MKQKSIFIESGSNGQRFPPPRPPPHPERYIKSQLSDWRSVRSLEPAESITGDSSLSSNPNLSRQSSSDASFSDEDEEHEVQQVCSCSNRSICPHRRLFVANKIAQMPGRSPRDREDLCRYSLRSFGQALGRNQKHLWKRRASDRLIQQHLSTVARSDPDNLQAASRSHPTSDGTVHHRTFNRKHVDGLRNALQVHWSDLQRLLCQILRCSRETRRSMQE